MKFMLFMLLCALARPLFASCGCASCPRDPGAYEQKEVGVLTLDYSYQYINQNEARTGVEPANVGQVRGHHDEVFTASRIQTFRLGTGITSRLSADVSLPFIQREHQHIHNHQGQKLLESWNFSGIGDLEILARFKVTPLGRPTQLFMILGGEFPTGRQDAQGVSQDTGNRLSGALAEVGIQPGSGSYDLIAGGSGLKAFTAPALRGSEGPAALFFSGVWRWNGKGHEEYKLGDSFTGTAGGFYPLTPKLAVSGSADMRYARKDGKGTTGEEVDKTGGVWVYATPGLRVYPAENWLGYIKAQVPVYQNVNVIQLASTYNLIFGATYKFGLF